MRELIEFRIPERSAQAVLAPSDGTTLGESVRKIALEPTDGRLVAIREADEKRRAEGGAFFTSWEVRRSYSGTELDAAAAFRLIVPTVFEPAGEECGTVYDETSACSICGAGSTQVGELRLDVSRIPRRCDLARSIADELVVSQRAAEALIDADLSGFDLAPVLPAEHGVELPIDLFASREGRQLVESAEAQGIAVATGEFWVWMNRRDQRAALDALREASGPRHAPRASSSSAWHHLRITSRPVPMSGRTQFGIDIFDRDSDGRYRCPRGHVAGLNILSEMHADVPRLPADFAVSSELVGERAGLLRPAPLLLVSQRVRDVFVDAGLKGYRLEVAHLRA